MTSPTKSSAPRRLAGEPDLPFDGQHGLTIAVLFDNANFFEGCYEASLREAFDARCRREGHNLLLVYGGPLDAPGPAAVADNTIFHVLQSTSADAMIVVSSMLAGFCGPEPVARLVAGYRPARLCSIGLVLPGVPSLVLDNRTAMEAAVDHLVREHGVRRPAFLAGPPNNPEAQARLQGYQDVLARHGIAVDPALVACGYFMPKEGRAAMDALLSSGVAFDAVVAANDNMALGAIEALRKWGRRVPRDVPVTGFDDLPLAALGNPPLTTVAQPLERMAGLAVDLVLAQLRGEPVAECTVLPSQFVRRRSCGCELEHAPRGVLPTVCVRPSSEYIDRLALLRPQLASVLRVPAHDASVVSDRLLEALRLDIAGNGAALARAVGDVLEDIGDDSQRHAMLEQAISWLRDQLADAGDLGLERAFYEALSLVASASTTMQERQRLTLEDASTTLLNVSEQAQVAFDLSSLEKTLIQGLPAAGVRTVFLSCAAEGNPGKLVPTVALVDGRAVDAPEPSFPASLLLPPSSRSLVRGRTFLVFPLAVEAQLLGVVAFAYADGVRSYGVFRSEITAVLRSIRLHQELVQKTMLHERSVQERLAATKRMEALRILAGGVAHDLNNALGPLVALPDLILRELTDLGVGGAAMAKVSGDIEIIKTASLRAAQTIKDLLTLGRQGRTIKQTVDFGRVVRSCLAETSLRLVEDKTRTVSVVADCAPEPLAVHGSDAQLARAIGNLLGNAIEAIPTQGEIVVRTRRERLSAPAGGYEVIPAGDYAVLTVTDDGCGIEAGDIPRIFEPFFSRKRPCDRSGSGLGLAIVHGVVKEHDGFIDVASASGKGTTFALYLPLTKRLEAPVATSASLGRAAAKILVIDDEAIQLRTCRRILTELGHDVEALDSGLRAFHAFKRAVPSGRSPYDLVIIDMALGEALDGLELFDQIEQLFPEQKAIIASGHAPTDRAELAVARGLVWLPKPYTVEALTCAVERVLAR